MIYQICDATLNINETRCICEYIFWTTTHLVIKFGQLIDISKSTIFRDLSNNLEDWGYVPGCFQFSNLPQLLNNQLHHDSSVSFFWNVEQGTIKNCKCQLLKMARSRNIVILIEIIEAGTSFQSPALS